MTRLFTDMGSVFVKNMADQRNNFVALCYHPPDSRVKAKFAKVSTIDQRPCVNLTTDRGTYQLTAEQIVRLADGSVSPVLKLAPGAELQSCIINNVDGDILVETAGRAIPIHLLVDADTQGIDLGIERYDKARFNGAPQVVQRIESGGLQDAYGIDVDCVSPKDNTQDSGHNFVVWSDGTSFGSGLFVM